MSNTIIVGPAIYSEDITYREGYIKIKNGLIEEVDQLQKLSNTDDYKVINVPSSFKMVPGMIDIHIHGVNGSDTMDATFDALSNMTKSLPKEGTTSFLATTITASKEAIEKALFNVSEYLDKHQKNGEAEILGIHLEGPFINRVKAGAQPIESIISPNIEMFNQWQKTSKRKIKVVTLAPETEGGMELIRYLHEQGVIASIGHTNANYEQVMQAIKMGAKHVTHLFNGMSSIHHRDPNTAGTALIRDELKVELIADTIHVHPEMLKLALTQKGPNGILLVTDAMRAKCLPNGEYDLGGQQVTVVDGKAVLDRGNLAGSVLKMNEAVRNMKDLTLCTIRDCILMSSVNQAKQLGVYDRKGSILKGKDADLVLLDTHDQVQMTWCKGYLAYKKEDCLT